MQTGLLFLLSLRAAGGWALERQGGYPSRRLSAGTLVVRSRLCPSVGSNNLHAEGSELHRAVSFCTFQKLAADVALEAVDLGRERGLFETQRRGRGCDGRVRGCFGKSAKPFSSMAVAQRRA
jgi:hypothetical protein